MSIIFSTIKSITSKGLRKQNLVIPRVIHVIWIGDQRLKPIDSIQTWQKMNPSFVLKVWGNAELASRSWRNALHMKSMWSKELAGVADMMRYEILFDEGGIYVDADSKCIRPLDDFLLEHDPFACWESELVRPGLIHNGFIGSSPGSSLLKSVIDDIANEISITDRPAWQTTGPMRLTNTFLRLQKPNLTIFPSHFFLPAHWSGMEYSGNGIIYSRHEWDSTNHKNIERGEDRPPCPLP